MIDRADRGEQIIIRRRDKTSYTLTPLHDDDDDELTPEMIATIDRGLESIRKGERGWVYSSEEFKKRFGI